jgi:hypothetical protein
MFDDIYYHIIYVDSFPGNQTFYYINLPSLVRLGFEIEVDFEEDFELLT